MRLLGNVVWFLLGGWLLFLVYTLGAVIFFPVFIPLFRLAIYSAWPFGRVAVSKNYLEKYRESLGNSKKISISENVFQKTSSLLNFLWLLTFGWILALIHFVSSILNLAFFFLIFTIPNIMGHWKLMKVSLMPFNKVLLPTELADEINLAMARKKLRI